MNYLLNVPGLIAISNFKTIAFRTARTGGASFLDIFVLAPGLHHQQDAADLNKGEYPATGAMTSGYVFRIENQATVAFLQRVGKTAHLTTVRVSPLEKTGWLSKLGLFQADTFASLLYLVCIGMTVAAIVLLREMQDWWALGVLCAFIFARFLNTIVIKRRLTSNGWRGAEEPGVEGDLIILLSQDRWVRMRGLVDDIKWVTAGEWLREPSDVECSATGLATLIVYASAALVGNASLAGSWLLAVLLVVSVTVLGLSNSATKSLRMFGRLVSVEKRQRYGRRLEMVNELVEEKGRDDWALQLGLIKLPQGQAQVPTATM